MEIGDVYKLAIVVVLIVMIVGVGILTLDKFAATTGLSAGAINALTNGSAALAEIPKTWLGLIITISVLAVIVGLVIGSFAGKATRR